MPSKRCSSRASIAARIGFWSCAATAALSMACFASASVDDRSGAGELSATDSLFGGGAIETQANVFTSSTQEHGAVAAVPGGGFVAVWDSRRQEFGGYAVVAQRFDAFGRPIGGEVPINLTVRGMQERPVITAAGEHIWIAWQSHGQDGSAAAVVARRFDLRMANPSGEIAVNQTQQGNQMSPAIVPGADGGALIAWVDDSAGSGRIMARRFDSAGVALGDEFQVSGDEPGACASPSLVCTTEGHQWIAWAHTEDGDPNRIVVRRIAADGALADDSITVNDMDAHDHIEPSLAAAAGGGFVAAWHTSVDGGFAVNVRFFDRDGSPLTDAVAVAEPSNGWKSGATVVRAADDRYLVTYNSDGAGGDGNGSGVMGLLIDAGGRILAEPVALNVNSKGAQAITTATGASRVVIDDAGRLAVCWNGESSEGDDSSVNLTVRLPRAMPVEDAPATVERLAFLPDAGESATPIPPIWDPNHVKLERLGSEGGDGPDFGFEGVTSTGWTPPDPEMAVSNDRILIITNGEISLFDKSGNNLFRDEIEDSFGFWGEVGATNFTFDPECVWDPHSNRLFAMACERSNTGRSMFLLAVSKTSTPNTRDDWWKYRIDVTAISDNDIDSPNMAVDANNVLLTADFFGPDKYLLYFIDKNSILSGGTPVTRHELITGASQQSMGIPVMHDADAPAQYILQSTELTTNNTVIFHACIDPFGTYSRPTFTLTVPSYTYPNQPPQRGSSSRPFLFEPRFWSCVQMNDSLWAVHHVNSSRARVRWYEFNMRGWPGSGNTPEIAQWGELDYGGTVHTFFPSIGVDAEGNAAITFARSSPDEYISMSRAVRKFSDPPGQFQPPQFVKESTAAHTSGRWGDYSATVNDPATLGSFWGHHEFTLNGQWRTWVARYDVGEPPMVLVSSRLVSGVRGTLDVTGATPGAQVVFLYSIRGLGSVYIPQLDVTVDIDAPVFIGARTADANGVASLSQRIPSGTVGRRIWLQAAEYQKASNVVETVIE
ncbi:MAG: hypothetical protein IT430_15645 [Phycisphaerales bacterium]|nr:hypothetical protein [Phycisphaerales bacterium]